MQNTFIFLRCKKNMQEIENIFDGRATPRLLKFSATAANDTRLSGGQARWPVEESQKEKGGGSHPLRFSGYCGFVPSVIFFA